MRMLFAILLYDEQHRAPPPGDGFGWKYVVSFSLKLLAHSRLKTIPFRLLAHSHGSNRVLQIEQKMLQPNYMGLECNH